MSLAKTFISHDLPLEFHPYAEKAAEAARCAGDQNKYWELRDTLIANSADLSPASILKYAQADALDMNGFRASLDSSKYKAEIAKDSADAANAGISGTPSFVIGKTKKNTWRATGWSALCPWQHSKWRLRNF